MTDNSIIDRMYLFIRPVCYHDESKRQYNFIILPVAVDTEANSLKLKNPADTEFYNEKIILS